MPPLPSTVAQPTGKSRAQQLYDTDGWTWAREQADALRQRAWSALDLENLIEEIEDMGKSQERAWRSFCANVIEHLLKIECQPDSPNLNHWRREISTWRDQMSQTIADDPGMKAGFYDMLTTAWKHGRTNAIRVLAQSESDERPSRERESRKQWKNQLPLDCPYHLAEIIGYAPRTDTEPMDDVWPASIARILNLKLDAGYPVSGSLPPFGSGYSR